MKGHTALPPSNQPRSKLIRPRSELIRSVYQELVPVGDILLKFTEAEEAAVSHPGRVSCIIAGSIAENDTLWNCILPGRNCGINILYGWFADAIKEAKAVLISQSKLIDDQRTYCS